MKSYIAIVASTGTHADKYMDFDTQEKAIDHVAMFGGFVAPNPGNDLRYWVVDDVAQTVTYDTAADIAAKVADAQTSKVYLINKKCADLESAGIAYLGYSFKCDAMSAGAAAAKLQRLRDASALSGEWIAIDNTIVPMTFAEFATFVDLLVAAQDGLVLAARTHKNAVGLLNTVVAIEAYNINTGWPV